MSHDTANRAYGRRYSHAGTSAGPGEWGQETVSLAHVDELKTLSHMCKGWFVWGDEEPDIKFVPMREWIDVFTDWETRHGR